MCVHVFNFTHGIFWISYEHFERGVIQKLPTIGASFRWLEGRTIATSRDIEHTFIILILTSFFGGSVLT